MEGREKAEACSKSSGNGLYFREDEPAQETAIQPVKLEVEGED